jgi:hypothetical protein
MTAVYWNVALCKLADVYRRLGGQGCLHRQGRWSSQKAAIFRSCSVQIQPRGRWSSQKAAFSGLVQCKLRSRYLFRIYSVTCEDTLIQKLRFCVILFGSTGCKIYQRPCWQIVKLSLAPRALRGQQTGPSRGSHCLFPSSTRNIKPGDKLISSFCFWRHIAYRLGFGIQIAYFSAADFYFTDVYTGRTFLLKLQWFNFISC